MGAPGLALARTGSLGWCQRPAPSQAFTLHIATYLVRRLVRHLVLDDRAEALAAVERLACIVDPVDAVESVGTEYGGVRGTREKERDERKGEKRREMRGR